MKYDTYWKRFVGVLISLCFLIFLVDYIIESDEDVVNQLYRPLIIGWYALVGIIFIYFSHRLLTEIKHNLHGPFAAKNAMRVKIVLSVFSIAIIYRVIFNTAYLCVNSKMCRFAMNNPKLFAAL